MGGVMDTIAAGRTGPEGHKRRCMAHMTMLSGDGCWLTLATEAAGNWCMVHTIMLSGATCCAAAMRCVAGDGGGRAVDEGSGAGGGRSQAGNGCSRAGDGGRATAAG
ncbi:hypothetical protein Vretifemale_10945 [Volvox reticuliferus]|uniref:Uncharacterized protein n=1 Tax=Volvox reticuliferus TaxID=1737510 RepID=A0A8J4FN66_9CHLO|nr:hypothetical protein Vretifemale_10945 [Volvox reticuliferus]